MHVAAFKKTCLWTITIFACMTSLQISQGMYSLLFNYLHGTNTDWDKLGRLASDFDFIDAS